MSGGKKRAGIVGFGVAACAACCAGPLLGVLAAIGLGTAAGMALFGLGAAVVGALAVSFVVVRRRRRQNRCTPTAATAEAPVAFTGRRDRS